jgi:hypothetical protein
MKPTQVAAIAVMLIAVIMTGFGGLQDMVQTNFQISRRHAWNDGIFLAILAVFLLLL